MPKSKARSSVTAVAEKSAHTVSGHGGQQLRVLPSTLGAETHFPNSGFCPGQVSQVPRDANVGEGRTLFLFHPC